MLPLYIPATDTIIRTAKDRYTHPETGEVYGGTDWDSATKRAECGALPLALDASAAPEGKVRTGSTIAVSNGAAIETVTYRDKTADEIARDAADALAQTDQQMARVTEDILARQDAILALLVSNNVIFENEKPELPAAAAEKIAERAALRAKL